MYKPVKFITEVPYTDFSTFYLFCRSIKTLLPIEIENSKKKEIPSIYNTVKRVLKGFNIGVSNIKIYHYYCDIFYAYLTLKKEAEEFEFNVGIKDALEISREMSVPIFVKDRILENYGIKITKDLLIKSLRDSD